ncbi:DUF3108 domain-containing protein [Undibacterium sp. RTI2.1]|uniref:DUF3108 domain-containing protein n=1 Tax=unclassified Undibacterium TaxID=2630295 RepID=UPI002AB3D7AF|nr:MULTISPECIES: DUF3108 domain-containing protein [unclassified Undibacterium]MDY7540068.1 DUF3108 domain-containing protein [Undibacterium sp. 5I1]MEB0031608.1 DUF3108 domain-containing protein [Undibacterium sp. RTI2.1]MEB0117821.1 DUF3108 domain-containing protein [Undibacterium sp. RTI2.2]MEB0232944.1 DUF3108 domain-containing protein [Undibacterium sp. 10I3]MEB0257915.1 DUF3108 domain-containing protein [Undibacterium sp. 5I1]
MTSNLLTRLRPDRKIFAFVLAAILLHVMALHWINSLPDQIPGVDIKNSEIKPSLLYVNQIQAKTEVATKVEAKPEKVIKLEKKQAIPPPDPQPDPLPSQAQQPAATPPLPGQIADGSQETAIYEATGGYLAVTPIKNPAPNLAASTSTFGAVNSTTGSPTGTITSATPPPAIPSLEQVASATKNTGTDNLPSAQFKVTPPPSAVLELQLVRSEANGSPFYGVGEINWHVSNNAYSMSVSAGLNLLVTTLNLLKINSDGKITDAGIAPVTSSESRRNRSETAIHFNYETKLVSFSSSNKSIPLVDGSQDKASVLMQLAGIGYADPTQFRVGREIVIQVAEERDATNFQFVIVGQEELKNKLGTLNTWHVVRPPRAGAYNSQLDIWFAPDKNWYPVQVRNTESNGAITTQIVTKITPQLN